MYMRNMTYKVPVSGILLTCFLMAMESISATSVAQTNEDYHTLTLVASPAMAGTFNKSTATLSAGSDIHLYAYANSNFSFTEWRNPDGTVISASSDFTYTMPDSDVTLTAVFGYNPQNPSNPARNYWNRELGEVIIDDFSAGTLSNAVSTVIAGSKNSDVLMITVAGQMNSNDFGVINNYQECTLFDICRVAGVNTVPSYAFDYTKLESVYLPASVERIGYRAFYSCSQLSSLTVYAMTPPVLENDVFKGVPGGMVVYVPAASITRYQEAAGWKEFVILPIQEDIRSITVSLPDGSDAQDYSQMWLELTNIKSGQKMHYVMTGRASYTFANIIRGTKWNAVLRNQRGDVFGRIDGIDVNDEDVSVTFASLSRPQSVSISVLTPDGTDVTARTQITLTDAYGGYLSQSSVLSGLLAGNSIGYRILLPQDLAMQYIVPEQKAYVVTDNDNRVVCNLTAITQTTISGTVRDIATRSALSGATISASQTFGGKYTKTVSTKTDAGGKYSLTVYNVPTSLAVAASDYISQTIVCDTLLIGTEAVTIPDISLKSITGAVITLSLTYRPSVKDGVMADVQGWYSDYNNVSFTIFNKTKQQTVNQFNVQYPSIVLLEEAEEGDVLELTVSSRNSAFAPVKTTATVDDAQHAEAVFEIVELGKIQASFVKNANAAVTGSLYDSKGKLLKSCNYSNASLTIDDLPDGDYTLVSMGQSRLFNTIYDLSQFPETGLSAGSDYIRNSVNVESGRISVVKIDEVPEFDESKLYYTGDNTSFTVNKSAIVAGNYLTLTGHVDFKPIYATKVSNFRLIVDLPESCSFVENSVMVGNTTGTYTLDGNRITIPMARYSDRVRFCIIPTLGGNYAPSALVQFDIDGKTVTQPIGSANYTAKDLSISVPSTVAKTSIPVSGTAIGASAIEIYDNGVLIGQTTSLANGTWATTCELNEPYNLSTHNIYAKVTTKSGLELQSENVVCIYDKNAIEVKTVTMINTAHPAGNLSLCEYTTVFDFQNPSQESPVYWYWPNYPDFTFIVDFTNNDTTVVRNVVLYVFMSDDNYEILFPTYDEKKDAFVASHKFTSSSLPVNVNVEFAIEKNTLMDCRQIDEMYNVLEEEKQNYEADKQEAEKKAEELEQYALTDEDDIEDYLTNKLPLYLSKYQELYGVDIPDDEDNPYSDMTPEEFFKKIEEEDIEDEKVLGEISADLEGLDDFYSNGPYFKAEQEVCDGKAKVTVETRPNDKTEQELQDEGFQRISEDGKLYERTRFPKDSNNTPKAPEESPNPPTDESVDISHNVYSKLDIQYKDGTSGYGYNDLCKDLMNFAANLATDDRVLRGLWEMTAPKHLLEIDRTLTRIEQKAIKDLKFYKETSEKIGLSKFEIDFQAGIERNETILKKVKKSRWKSLRGLQTINTTVEVTSGIGSGISGGLTVSDDINKMEQLKKTMNVSVPYCVYSKNPKAASDIDDKMVKLMKEADNWELMQCCRTAIWELTAGASAPSLIGPIIIGHIQNKTEAIRMERKFNELSSRASLIKSEMIQATAKYCSREEVRKLALQMFGLPQDLPMKSAQYVLDPSGYVYEGVSSHRLEGVTATAYYKEMVEDMYGDLHENIVKWDAEEYAQENPLFTDENGYYRWDVPQGMWQVKFEKEGYETTQSEWLPVPPPQLDVNIAMTQNVQPNVMNARAYEDAVEMEFDKYMIPELLNTDNISVMTGDSKVDGTIELLNEESSYEGSTETYASKVRFNAAAPFEGTEVTLMVSNRVKSYAGIRMQDDYSQQFTIEQEVRRIECDSAVAVGYGSSGAVAVTVLPASASAGKTLNVHTSSSMIISTDVTSVVLDSNGKAEISVAGELPGTAAMIFNVDGYDLSATTIINVEQIQIETVATPVASIASGTTVPAGTTVTLTCATDGALIYYTLDGSCPCNETDAVKLYDGTPIVISGSVTIKAMAVMPGMYDSNVAEFTYLVNAGAIELLENVDNSEILESLYETGNSIDICLKRTVKAGMWNTMCLPFDFDLTVANTNDNPLAGAKVMEFVNGELEGDVLSITFNNVNEITAGKPFFVKLDDGATDKAELEFKSVKITALSGTTVGSGSVQMTGVINTCHLSSDNKYVFLSGDRIGKLSSNEQNSINGFRAYLDIVPLSGDNILKYVKFSDGEITGIELINARNQEDGKFIENGQIYIIHDGIKSNIKGVIMESAEYGK